MPGVNEFTSQTILNRVFDPTNNRLNTSIGTVVTVSGSAAFINETANANNSNGLTINQEAADDQVLTFKSSDVAHGITSIGIVASETDDFGSFAKLAGANGGLYIGSYGENVANVVNTMIENIGGVAGTVKTTAGRSLIELLISQHDGANALANIAADGNIFGVRARVGGANTTRFMVDEDGDVFVVTVVDVAGTGNALAATAFDAYDDVGLVRAFERSRLPTGLIETQWDKFVESNEEDLVRLGILGAPVKDGGMWNLTQHVRLLNGAIWQLYTALQTTKERLQLTEARLALLPGGM